jgi:5-methylcytosine-specific restriction endonuclease McrA
MNAGRPSPTAPIAVKRKRRVSMLLRLFKYLLTWCGVGVSKARYEWINSNDFLASQEWIELRYRVLRESDGRCCLCGRGAADGAKLNVDHIKPRRTHPSLALVRSNLQVLCSLCNRGKGNRSDDWRRSPSLARPWLLPKPER